MRLSSRFSCGARKPSGRTNLGLQCWSDQILIRSRECNLYCGDCAEAPPPARQIWPREWPTGNEAWIGSCEFYFIGIVAACRYPSRSALCKTTSASSALRSAPTTTRYSGWLLTVLVSILASSPLGPSAMERANKIA